MLAIPLKRAFYLEKGDGGDSEGRSGDGVKTGAKKKREAEKRAKKEKGTEAYLTTFGARISKGDDIFKPIRDDSGSGRK